MHKELYIARGVAKSLGNNRSAEQGLSTINLLDASSGFSLNPVGGWIPQIVGLKNGGVWADSAVNTGRQLVAGEDGNVTETIRLTITPGDFLALFKQVARLNRFIQDCRQFNTTFYQIEPVFLWWWAECAPGPQYAKVFSIDMTVDYSGDQSRAVADVVLSLEREPYWRALPPGANPRQWTYYVNHASYITGPYPEESDLSLVTETTNHFVYDTSVNNKCELDSSGAEPVVLTRNYIDIDGEDIPGDAPALMAISIQGNSLSFEPTEAYIARSTNPRSLPRENRGSPVTGTMYQINTMIAARGSKAVADTTNANDTGGVNDSTGTNKRVNIAFSTTAADAARISWSQSSALLTETMQRGQYAVFVRARQVNGASGDINFHMEFEFNQGQFLTVRLPDITPILSGTTGNTSGWPLHYMGTVTIPPIGRTTVSAAGWGQNVEASDYRAVLWAERTAGVGVLYICDVIIVPFDEFSCLAISDNPIVETATVLVVDNTGYLLHGEQGDYVSSYAGAEIEREVLPELRGNALMLKPGVNNRLYFLFNGQVSSTPGLSDPNTTYNIRINVIPRWVGVRDT